MAIYRLEAKIIGRSSGQSATASAAYRAADRIDDERSGARFDYSRKRGVLHTEIIAPEGTPAWMHDRAQLWNAVEKVEKRKDAQLARDLVLSLPHELTPDQRIDLVREFVSSEFVTQGMIADVAFHAPHRDGDARNYHAHVMLTTRELAGDGFGKKAREWNAPEQLEQWRAHWAASVNHHLEQHGHEARVDHRSLTDQGIEREPEPKQGPIATEMERQGRASHAGDDRRAAKERNEERAAVEAALAIVSAEIIDLEEERARREQPRNDNQTAAAPIVEPSPTEGDTIQEASAQQRATAASRGDLAAGRDAAPPALAFEASDPLANGGADGVQAVEQGARADDSAQGADASAAIESSTLGAPAGENLGLAGALARVAQRLLDAGAKIAAGAIGRFLHGLFDGASADRDQAQAEESLSPSLPERQPEGDDETAQEIEPATEQQLQEPSSMTARERHTARLQAFLIADQQQRESARQETANRLGTSAALTDEELRQEQETQEHEAEERDAEELPERGVAKSEAAQNRGGLTRDSTD